MLEEKIEKPKECNIGHKLASIIFRDPEKRGRKIIKNFLYCPTCDKIFFLSKQTEKVSIEKTVFKLIEVENKENDIS